MATQTKDGAPGANGQAGPPKAGKPIPEGVEKQLKCSLEFLLQSAESGALPPVNPADQAQVDKFFAAPAADEPPQDFEVCSEYCLPLELKVVKMAAMTAKKRPMVIIFHPDTEEPNSEGSVVIAVRGDRKQLHPKVMKLKQDRMVRALLANVFVAAPMSSCNLHPWYSSILTSYMRQTLLLPDDRNFSNPAQLSELDADSKQFKNALQKHRITIVVCPANSIAVETQFHKLAHDQSQQKTTEEERQAHEAAWLASVDEVAEPWMRKYFEMLKSLCEDMHKAPELLNAVKREQSTAKSSGSLVDKSTEKAKAAEKPSDTQVAKAHKKEKRGERHERNSGQSKFIRDTMVSSREEDEREEEETRKFEEKLKRTKDSDSDEDDADRPKKSKARKLQSDSEEESEMSDDSDDSSAEDDSDEEDSDEEDSDEDDSDEESATSSDDEVENKPPKRKRLVKGSEAAATGRPVNAQEGPKLTQTKLSTGGSAVVPAASAAAAKAAKTTSRQVGGAHGARVNVASQAGYMLDAVEACQGIPFSSLEKIKKLSDTLRKGFADYQEEKFPIGSTYALHTTTFELTMALVHALNATITPEQQTADANTTRRLAVNTTSAILQIIPSLQHVMTSLTKGVEAISQLDSITKSVAEEFGKTASNITEE